MKKISDFKTKFSKNIKILGNNDKIVLNAKNEKKRLLIFNSLDNEECALEINFNSNDEKYTAFYFDLAGKFDNLQDKEQFYYEYTIQKRNYNWLKEIYALYETFNLWNKPKMKIYKFEKPDFIIEYESEIKGIEVTAAYTKNFKKKLDNPNEEYEKRKELYDCGMVVVCNTYEEINEKNIKVIKKHFENHAIYLENIGDNFKKNKQLFYVVDLSGGERLAVAEKWRLNEINNLAIENFICNKNIILKIGNQDSSIKNSYGWDTLFHIIENTTFIGI